MYLGNVDEEPEMKKLELNCGCIVYADGSKIVCEKHTPSALKELLRKSVRVR